MLQWPPVVNSECAFGSKKKKRVVSRLAEKVSASEYELNSFIKMWVCFALEQG